MRRPLGSSALFQEAVLQLRIRLHRRSSKPQRKKAGLSIGQFEVGHRNQNTCILLSSMCTPTSVLLLLTTASKPVSVRAVYRLMLLHVHEHDYSVPKQPSQGVCFKARTHALRYQSTSTPSHRLLNTQTFLKHIRGSMSLLWSVPPKKARWHRYGFVEVNTTHPDSKLPILDTEAFQAEIARYFTARSERA